MAAQPFFCLKNSCEEYAGFLAIGKKGCDVLCEGHAKEFSSKEKNKFNPAISLIAKDNCCAVRKCKGVCTDGVEIDTGMSYKEDGKKKDLSVSATLCSAHWSQLKKTLRKALVAYNHEVLDESSSDDEKKGVRLVKSSDLSDNSDSDEARQKPKSKRVPKSEPAPTYAKKAGAADADKKQISEKKSAKVGINDVLKLKVQAPAPAAVPGGKPISPQLGPAAPAVKKAELPKIVKTEKGDALVLGDGSKKLLSPPKENKQKVGKNLEMDEEGFMHQKQKKQEPFWITPNKAGSAVVKSGVGSGQSTVSGMSDLDRVLEMQEKDAIKYVEAHKEERKTKLCKKNRLSSCEFGEECDFAHSLAEQVESKDLEYLRKNPTYKTVICTHYNDGFCINGKNCTYAHGKKELRKKKTPCPLEAEGKVCYAGAIIYHNLTADEETYHDEGAKQMAQYQKHYDEHFHNASKCCRKWDECDINGCEYAHPDNNNFDELEESA